MTIIQQVLLGVGWNKRHDQIPFWEETISGQYQSIIKRNITIRGIVIF